MTMKGTARFSLDVKISLALFVAVFLVYLLTLCPTIYLGPSADAVCAVEGVGLTPPISHPIWLIVGRLVAHFSSNTAYVLNLMSALFGAATIALLYAVLSKLSHTKTAEEEARYQTHPHLRQVAALAAALLVAFSHPFWEGSVLAGADTLNTFLLVLAVFLLARYVKTSKSRYAIVFALLYGLAITNYPTLFLLAPVFLIFLLLRCRSLLDDPVAIVLMFLLFGVGLLPSLYEPHAYSLQGKEYVVHAKTFGLAFSAFADTYFRTLKGLFLQKNTPHDWIFWLALPTFVPILFFMIRRGEYDRGSPKATRFTYLVRHAFVALFALGGLGYLWGFRVGPEGMAGLEYLMDPRYLGSYVLVGGWLAYVIGYWLIVATGKFKATGTDPEPKVKYRKAGYVAGVVIALALPLLGFLLNHGKSTKRGADHAERFAEGLLRSTGENAIIIVPWDPYFESIGPPLRYVYAKHAHSSLGRGRTIIDLNAAFFDFHKRKHFYFYLEKRVETAQYLAESAFGREVNQPRTYFLPEWPFGEVYDGILRCETVRALEAGERPRTIYGLNNNFFLSPVLAGNELMNKDYRAEPAGLLYAYRSRLEYRDRAAVIKNNERLWAKLLRDIGVTTGDLKRRKGSAAQEYIFGEYAKAANDFGAYCQLAGRPTLARRYYRRALLLSPENSSAMQNMATVLESTGESKEAEELKRKYQAAIKKHEEQEADFFRQFGISLDFDLLVTTEAVVAAQVAGQGQREKERAATRRLAMLRLAAEMMPRDARVRERIGDVLLSSKEQFAEQEARSEYLAALERTDPNDREEMKRIAAKLGGVYSRLGRNADAESYFKKALDPDDLGTLLVLMNFYGTTAQKPSEIERLGRSILEKAPANEVERRSLAPAKAQAAFMVAKVKLKSEGPEKTKEFLTEYLAEQPGQADLLLTLASQLLNDPTLDAFTIWLFRKYEGMGAELPVLRRCQLAEAYLRQGQPQTVVQMEVPTAAGASMDLARFHYSKGLAYEALGKPDDAKESYETARSLLPADYGNLGVVLTNNLSWLYFKEGEQAKSEGNTPEAEAKYRQALDIVKEAVARDPANSLIWDTYGWILHRTGGDFSTALELLESSHLANPDVGIIAYHYGKLLMEKGLKGNAIIVLERAIESGIEGKEELEDAKRILEAWRAGEGTADTGA